MEKRENQSLSSSGAFPLIRDTPWRNSKYRMKHHLIDTKDGRRLTPHKNPDQTSEQQSSKRDRKKYDLRSTLTKSEPHCVEDTLNASQLSYNCQLWAPGCCLSGQGRRTPRTLVSLHSWCHSPPTSLRGQAQSVQVGVNSEHTTRRTFNTERPRFLNYHSVHKLSCLEPVVFRGIRPRTCSVISGDFPHSQNWKPKMTLCAEAAMTILWTAQDRLTKQGIWKKLWINFKLRLRQIADATTSC